MIYVNGEPAAHDGCTIAELVVRLGLPASVRGVAIAVDGEVVSRGMWDLTRLEPGARVEIVKAVQGG